jgi:hypothetical protein
MEHNGNILLETYKRSYYTTRELVIDYLNNPSDLTKALLINELDIEICPVCKEYCDELEDTEGMINSGVGYICSGCKEDL